MSNTWNISPTFRSEVAEVVSNSNKAILNQSSPLVGWNVFVDSFEDEIINNGVRLEQPVGVLTSLPSSLVDWTGNTAYGFPRDLGSGMVAVDFNDEYMFITGDFSTSSTVYYSLPVYKFRDPFGQLSTVTANQTYISVSNKDSNYWAFFKDITYNDYNGKPFKMLNGSILICPTAINNISQHSAKMVTDGSDFPYTYNGFPSSIQTRVSISLSGVVKTSNPSLANSTTEIYKGGLSNYFGQAHLIPGAAALNGIGTYITFNSNSQSHAATTYTYPSLSSRLQLAGGVLSSDGKIYFVPTGQVSGVYYDSGLIVNSNNTTLSTSTYTLPTTVSGGVYFNAGLDLNGDINILCSNTNVIQKISSSGVITTAPSLPFNFNHAEYFGSLLGPDGSIHVIPYTYNVADTTNGPPFKISKEGVVTTYSYSSSTSYSRLTSADLDSKGRVIGTAYVNSTASSVSLLVLDMGFNAPIPKKLLHAPFKMFNIKF